MNFFHFIPLEERIVLDATLISAFISGSTLEGTGLSTTTANSIDAGISFQITPADNPPTSGRIDWGDGTPFSNVFNITHPFGSYNFNPDAASSQHIYLNPGVYSPKLLFSGSNLAALTFAQITVNDQPLTLQGTSNPINAVEGIVQHVTFFQFKDGDPNADALKYSSSVLNLPVGATVTNIQFTETSPTSSIFNVTGNVQFTDVASGTNLNIQINEFSAFQIGVGPVPTSSLSVLVPYNVADAPLTPLGSAVSISGQEGQLLSHTLIGNFHDANQFSTAADFSALVSGQPSTMTISNVSVEAGASAGDYKVFADILPINITNSVLNLTVNDVDGASLVLAPSINIANGFFSIVEVAPVSGVEGSLLTDVTIGAFKDSNLFETASDFTLINTNNPTWATFTNRHIVQDVNPGSFLIKADVLFKNVISNVQLPLLVIDDGVNQVISSAPFTVTNAPLSLIESESITGTQGSSATHVLLGKFLNAVNSDSYTAALAPSLAGNLALSNISFVLDPTQGPSGYLYDVYADVAFLQDTVGQTVPMAITVSDQDPGPVSIALSDSLRVFDVPLVVLSSHGASGVEGSSLTAGLVSFVDPEGFNQNSYQVVIDWGDQSTTVGSPGQYIDINASGVVASHTYAETGNYTIHVSIFDAASGDQILSRASQALISDAPLNANVVAPVALNEGAGLNGVLIGRFQDGNTLSVDPSEFAVTASGLPGVASLSNIVVQSAGAGLFNIYGDIAATDIANFNLGLNVKDLNGTSQVDLLTAIHVNNAPLSVPLPLNISANAGVAFNGIVGSFTDANIYDNLSDFSALITWGDGSQSQGVISLAAPGIYNIAGSHTYASNPDGLVGSISIADIEGGGANLDFHVTSQAAQQLLYGVDQSNGQLFSVADYSLPGAENRVNLYGQLHTSLGTIIGGKVYAFTIDAADGSGKNSAFLAISKPIDGINTFSIGVIADINDAANRTNVTLFGIKGIDFNMATDSITGLAIDPLTGNLEGVIVRGNSPATLFVLNKNDLSLASTTHLVQGYVLGRMVGLEDHGQQRITNARDLVFDQAHNLYVTDASSDKLYRINNNTGEILGIANRNEDIGAVDANIQALAYDPVLNKVLGANSILNAGLPANDLVGLSLNNGQNTTDVHLLSQLKDVQSMAFLPNFALKTGADLGLLIDIKSSEVDYKAGSGPILLLHDVNIIDFGDKNYDGASLVVDVSANPNALTDILGIKEGEGIKINSANGEIRFKGMLIGVIDSTLNGKNGQALQINFNANATEKAVESLMDRLTYMNTSKNLILGDRTIEISLYDQLHTLIAYTTIDLDIEKKGC